jgi:adenylate cyclase
MAHQLAAILVADVVGYARLMGADETGTLDRLKQSRRDVIDPSVRANGGRIVKSTGDGILAEFPSAISAVASAIEIQAGMARGEGQIAYRIGVNLGDVIHDAGDVFGDGVNVAARLEQLAEPGGICVSRAVFDQVRDKLALEHEYLGEQHVKNIARPLKVYRIRAAAGYAPAQQRRKSFRPSPTVLGGIAAAAAIVAIAGIAAFWRSAAPDPSPVRPRPPVAATEAPRLSLVVLPFVNLSSDPDHEGFVDGITDDLITDLSRIAGALVTSRSTSFTFKDKQVDVRHVAEELGVRYVLEGSVRRIGDQMRVTAQLVDASGGGPIWADRLDLAALEIDRLQDEVTGRIARALNLELIAAESRRKPSGDLAAIDLTMRGWTTLWNRPQTRETNVEGKDYLLRALQIDPENAQALAALCYAHTRDAQFGWVPSRTEALRLAIEAGEKATKLAPRDADAWYALGYARRSAGEVEQALHILEHSVALNPNHTPALAGYGYTLILVGQPAKSIAWFERALRLSPLDPLRAVWFYQMALAHLVMGNDKVAHEWTGKAVAANPRFPGTYWVRAAALAGIGQEAEARAAIAEYRRISANGSVAWIASTVAGNATFEAQRRPALDRLLALGLPQEK